MKTALVCWLGGRDLEPFKGTTEKRGPIQSTLQARPHKQLHLLYNEGLLQRYEMDSVDPYVEWLTQRFEVEVFVRKAQVESPVHYGDIYKEANKLLTGLVEVLSKDDISVLVSPGTPQMHAVWLLMCKTSFDLPMLESSEEQGVEDVDVPFDISADFLPTALAETDLAWRRLFSGDSPTNAAFEDIFTNDPDMKAQIVRAKQVAELNEPVLILGESGTGKELFAKAIHTASLGSPWNNGVLKTLNCGALSPELVDSELFGHAKGAFTGATDNKVGMFEAADGGTIFLDEFGELSAETQVRLLRVVQDGTYSRVGEHQEREVKVRIIAATNRNLLAEIAEGSFRQDLFYRIAVGIIELPPLRQREGDLMELTDRLLELVNAKGEQTLPDYKHRKLSVKAKNIIRIHGWPGNIRELQACLTRACAWSNNETINERVMRDALLQSPAKAGDLLGREFDNSFKIQELIDDLKGHYIKKAMKEAGENKTKAAKMLGLNNYQTLTKWRKDLGLED